MKRIVKYIILGIVIIAAAAGTFYSLNAPITVPLYQVTAKTAELSFSEQGIIVAENEVKIYPLTSGKLLQVNVLEGQEVNAGDVLCVIDPEPLTLKINQIRSGIKSYEAQMSNLQTEQQKARDELSTSKNRLLNELAAMEAQEQSNSVSVETQNISLEEKIRLQNIIIEQNQKDLDRAKSELSIAENLYNAGIIPKTDYDDAIEVVTKCESALDASKQELNVIASGVIQSDADYYEAMKASLNAQIAGINQSIGKNYTAAMTDYYRALMQADEVNITQIEKEIENCNVVATVGGVVTTLNVKNTNIVSNTMPVAEITVLNGNNIEVYVSTKDVDSIKVGESVGLTLKRRRGDVDFTGKITHIDSTAEVKLTALGVEERKVKVNVSPNMAEIGSASLGVGYNIDVKFLIYNEANKITAPKTALFKDNDRDYVWVVRDGKAYTAEVVKGMELRTEFVIESGLAEGDIVITDANNKDLKNGVSVNGE